MFKLKDSVYDTLKWIALICLPALGVAYSALANVWGWAYADEIARTVNAVCALLGSLLGISTVAYNKQK